MRRITTGIVAGLLLLSAHHAQAFDEKGGNALWGKYAIQTCRSCHKEKGLSSLAPEEKSGAEWESFFVDRYKKLRDMDHNFSAIGINERQLENIHRYLVEDSAKREENKAPETTALKTIGAKPKKVLADDDDKMEGAGLFNPSAGDARKGRYVFRRCLTCHKKNDAPIISPADRTKAAWERYFANDFKKLKKDMPKFDTYGFSMGQMADLHQFVLQYALDASKPKTCE
jgi:cytochrome c2